MTQYGDTAIENQSLKRNLFSGAFDWHITNDILLQFDASYRDYSANGLPASWRTASSSVTHPSAPDADELWSQKWTFQKIEMEKAGMNLKWNISDVFTLRTAYHVAEYTDESRGVVGEIQNNSTYAEIIFARAPRKLDTTRGYAFLDAHFNTFFIEHKLTMGFFGDTAKWRLHGDDRYAAYLSGSFPLSDPVYVPVPSYTIGTKPWHTDFYGTNKNYIIGDNIKFNDSWSALVGLNHATILARDYDSTEVQTDEYDKSATTPSLSLVYKPVPSVTTYATYMESLEQGTIVGINYTNAGTILEPLVSRQYEVGVKATVGGVLLTGALFRIDKANQYAINTTPLPTYVQDGREVHQGIELTASGKVTDHLTLLGGLTFMSAAVERTNDPSLVGKKPTNVAEQYAKLYAEYSLPWIKGLTLTGGVYYTGTQYADALNTDRLPAYVIGDVGARYETKIYGYPTIFRLNVTNVTDKSYWMSDSFVGDPRSIAFSAQVKF